MTTISQRLSLPNQALLFDLERVYRCLQTVPDRRKRRGQRYPLEALLMIGMLAKLAAGEPPRHLTLGQAAQTRLEPPVPIEAADDATLQHLEPRAGSGRQA